jgi:nitrogenase molybdenum-iron protein alpha chain
VNYGEKILDTLENDEFVKNLQRHAINPYSAWWFDQASDAFMKGQSR